MKRIFKKLVTPVTVLAVALLSGLYALGAWAGMVFWIVTLLHPQWNVRFPIETKVFWVVGAPAWTLATVALLKWRRRIRRRLAGLCVGCGYDIRASWGRCPECGRVCDEQVA